MYLAMGRLHFVSAAVSSSHFGDSRCARAVDADTASAATTTAAEAIHVCGDPIRCAMHGSCWFAARNLRDHVSRTRS